MSSGKIAVFLSIALIASFGNAQTQVCKAPDGHKTVTNEGCKAPYIQTELDMLDVDTSMSKRVRLEPRKLAQQKEKLAKVRAMEMKRILEKQK